jgi:hypothetical protein
LSVVGTCTLYYYGTYSGFSIVYLFQMILLAWISFAYCQSLAALVVILLGFTFDCCGSTDTTCGRHMNASRLVQPTD